MYKEYDKVHCKICPSKISLEKAFFALPNDKKAYTTFRPGHDNPIHSLELDNLTKCNYDMTHWFGLN